MKCLRKLRSYLSYVTKNLIKKIVKIKRIGLYLPIKKIHNTAMLMFRTWLREKSIKRSIFRRYGRRFGNKDRLIASVIIKAVGKLPQ